MSKIMNKLLRVTCIIPALEEVHLHLPILMLDVSKDDTKTDDSDSDKSKSFWGSPFYEETETEE